MTSTTFLRRKLESVACCPHTHTHTHTPIITYIYISIYISISLSISIRIYINTYIYIYTPVSISISIYLYLHIHISCLYLYVDLYLSIYEYICIYIYTYMCVICNMATFFDVVSCSVISDGALAVTWLSCLILKKISVPWGTFSADRLSNGDNQRMEELHAHRIRSRAAMRVDKEWKGPTWPWDLKHGNIEVDTCHLCFTMSCVCICRIICIYIYTFI